MQAVTVGRQQGQGFSVYTDNGAEFVVEVVKCPGGYVRLRIDCAEPFTVEIPKPGDRKYGHLDHLILHSSEV